MTTDEFFIDEAQILRDIQIEDESGCDIRAGINHGTNLGGYICQALSGTTYDRLKELLSAKTGKVFSTEDVDQIVCELQREMLASASEEVSMPTAKSA
ncbi:hypothetical protein B9G53_01030 [Pseudanabaena sp. SR411]|uniref:hypothetical protein n=1 Tax=Pseudanabaena sp. SR411 TaxID=1980935 RepID=UPI000B98A41D|nr:hypothetical protein [Pseudanabaena sp. SR411]OYQ67566.1 hypothetical protein B9G53_01030 [Pseudanabaena sp. SR411]